MIGVRFPAGAKVFPSSLCVLSGSGAHPASCPLCSEGPFPGGKAWPVRDADHSLPSSADVMNELKLYVLSPQASSWRVVGLLTFTFVGAMLSCMCVYIGITLRGHILRCYTLTIREQTFQKLNIFHVTLWKPTLNGAVIMTREVRVCV
jgi:hypothetical protein